jgi:hypothetical protein
VAKLRITPEQWLYGGGIAIGAGALYLIARRVFGAPDGEGGSDLESVARQAIDMVVPCDEGDERFELMTNGSYAHGYGTTCGYLCHFQIGCRDPSLVNWNDPASGLSYHVGQNISMIVNGAKKLDAWRSGPADIKPYDIVFTENYAGGKGSGSEHVFIFVREENDGSAWHSADAGRRNAAGNQAAEFVTRDKDGNKLLFLGGEWRNINGYVDLSAVPITAEPLQAGVQANRSATRTRLTFADRATLRRLAGENQFTGM